MSKKQYGRVALFLIILLLLFHGCSVTAQTELDAPSSWYDEPKDSLDVIFIGPSTINQGILPMELWNEYGIASYNLGSNGQSIPISYWIAKEAIQKQHPQILVVDVYLLHKDVKYYDKEDAHAALDNMRLSKFKLDTIQDVLPQEMWMEYIVPFYLYHDRWRELDKDDFSEGGNDYLKGAFLSWANREYSPLQIRHESYRDLHPVIEEYLVKLITLCDENDVNLVLIAPPYPDTDGDSRWEFHQPMINTVELLANKKGIPFINLLYQMDEMNFSWETDFQDNVHVNALGALKVTDYLGQFLSKNYAIPDRRNDPAYQRWHEDYAAYQKLFQQGYEGFLERKKAGN